MQKLERKHKKEIEREAQKKQSKRYTQKRKPKVKSGKYHYTTRKKRKKKQVVGKLQTLSLRGEGSSVLSISSSGAKSEAECPKCSIINGDDDAIWIKCDKCGLWWDLKCSGVTSSDDVFHCS